MLTHFFTNGSFEREYRTQAVAPPASETVATYLNKRLKQIGVGHVFCIPGDYLAEWAETLDDPAQNAGLVRVHPNNEMCAAYAADGYGRVANGPIGCVAFTYGDRVRRRGDHGGDPRQRARGADPADGDDHRRRGLRGDAVSRSARDCWP